MTNMFWQCDEFEQDISGWDTAEVTTMEQMFVAFNGAVNLTEWVRINYSASSPPSPPP